MSEQQSKILLVAATQNELPIIGGQFRNLQIESLVTGVGMVATTFHLSQLLVEKHFDLIVNVGIAGAFTELLPIGSVVQVTRDRLAELGVEDKDKFISAETIDLVEKYDLEFITDVAVEGLAITSGITVNQVHGSEDSIAKVREQFNPDLETMEGAAIGYVCSKLGVRWCQIRSISNRVEPRDKGNWNIPLALKNLHQEVLVYLQRLNETV